MIRRMTTAMVAMMMVSGLVAADEQDSLNAEKSKINFVGSKPDGKHDGGFKKFTAEGVIDLENSADGSLEIVIDATSLWSDNDKLTNHLKNPDFFDVRKYPKITFKATKIEHDKDDKNGKKVDITGVLTMLGKEVTVTIPATAKVTDSEITLKSDFKIDRTKWGMNYGQGKINNGVLIKAVLVLDR